MYYLYDKPRALVCGTVLAVGLMVVSGTQSLFMSTALTEATTSSESLMERLRYWPRVMGHLAANPLGIGLGMVGGPHLFEAGAGGEGDPQSDPSASFDPEGRTGADNVLSVTDNAYLKLLIQGGFPLLIIFLAVIGATIRAAPAALRTIRDPELREVAIWAIASFASLLTICLFVDFFEAAPAISIYWLAIGILCSLRKRTLEQQA